MAAGQKMQITIIGMQYMPDVQDHAETDEQLVTTQQVEAEYFHKGESRYLFYEEQPEGFPAPLKTRIKLKNQTLEIHRQGPGGSTMFFAPGQTYRTEYPTPYGTLLLDIVTSALSVGGEEANDIWPDVTVEYILQNEGETLSKYCLSISANH